MKTIFELKEENEKLKKENEKLLLIYIILEDEYKELSKGNTPKDRFMKEWIDNNWKSITERMAELMYEMAESTWRNSDEDSDVDSDK
jgi:hypothetical protein